MNWLCHLWHKWLVIGHNPVYFKDELTHRPVSLTQRICLRCGKTERFMFGYAGRVDVPTERTR